MLKRVDSVRSVRIFLQSEAGRQQATKVVSHGGGFDQSWGKTKSACFELEGTIHLYMISQESGDL